MSRSFGQRGVSRPAQPDSQRERPWRRTVRVPGTQSTIWAPGRAAGAASLGGTRQPAGRPVTGPAWDPQEGCPRFARGRAAVGHEAHKAIDPC